MQVCCLDRLSVRLPGVGCTELGSTTKTLVRKNAPRLACLTVTLPSDMTPSVATSSSLTLITDRAEGEHDFCSLSTSLGELVVVDQPPKPFGTESAFQSSECLTPLHPVRMA